MSTPRQRIPLKQKDADWKKANMLYWYNKCYPKNAYFETLFKAANGELEETDYSYMLNPFGDNIKGREHLKSYPAKLKNYPLIPSIVQLLIAEKRQTPIVALVGVTNPDSVNIKQQQEFLQIKQSLSQLYLNTLQEMGINIDDSGLPEQDVPELQEVMKGFGDNWKDFRAIVGQDILDFILDDCAVPQKFIKGYVHWLVTGTVTSIKDVRGEDVVYEIINPKNVGYIADETVEYLEDAEAVSLITRITRASFLDNYAEIIARENEKTVEEIYEFLDNRGLNLSEPYVMAWGTSDLVNQNEAQTSSYNQHYNYGYDSLNAYNDLADTIEVAYINWTSQEKVKVIGVTNELGEVEELEVPEDYVVESQYGEFLIEEFWRNQKWEGYIANGRKVVFGVRPIPFQRNKINRKSSCKNLINGRIRRMGNRRALSPVELLLSYQHLWNVVHFKINLILAKNKEKLMIMPIQLIPQNEGIDMFAFMYHADASGIAWVDASKPEVINALNAIKSIDLSMGNYLASMFAFLDRIQAEAEGVLGINPQRKAQITGKAGLGVTSDAIAQSQLMTLDLLEQYEEFEQTELNGLLDLSKFAYINGKKASYINSEGRQILISIDAANQHFMNSEFGVRVKNSAKEKHKLDKMKQFAETLASQKVNPTTLGHILNAEDNFEKLLDKLKDLEAEERAIANQQAEADRQLQDTISQRQKDTDDSKIALEYYKIDANNQNDLEVKQLDNAGKQNTMDSNGNNVPDFIDVQAAIVSNNATLDKVQNERDKLKLDFHKFVQADALEKKKVSQKDRELDLKEKDIDTKLRIAKENRNKYDGKK